MPLLHIVILAAVQGITEFLPISSSGHLVIVRELGGNIARTTPQQELIVDVAVHVGTLGAVVLYFWRDIVCLTMGVRNLARGRMTPGGRLAVQLLIATLPIILIGLLAKDLVMGSLRSIEVIAWATIGFGVLLLIGDRVGTFSRRVENLSNSHAVVIGISQYSQSIRRSVQFFRFTV